MAWMSGYLKRKKLILTGGASGALTNHQLKIAMSHDAAMDGDFDDLRFTQADGTTLIDAWAEVIVTDTSAIVWVEFPTTPANTVTQDYYMYYGNAGVGSDWDGAATFAAFIDKNSTSGWTLDDNMTVTTSGEFLRFYGSVSGTSNHARRTDWTTPAAWALEYQMKNINIGMDAGNVSVLDGGTADRFTAVFSPMDSVVADKIYCWGDGVWDQLGDWTEGTEYIIIQVVDESNSSTGVDYFYYDTSRALLGSSVGNPFYYGSPTDADGIMIGDQSSSEYSDLYIRWMFIRKYAANPPTYEFGSEESASVTRMVYQGGFNTYKFNGVQVVSEGVVGHPTMRRWGGIPGMQYTGRRSW